MTKINSNGVALENGLVDRIIAVDPNSDWTCVMKGAKGVCADMLASALTLVVGKCLNGHVAGMLIDCKSSLACTALGD